MRPSLYKPEYCEMLIEHMSEGYSFMSFAAVADCTRKTLYNWLDEYPDFKEAYGRAKPKNLMHCEKVLKAKTEGIQGLGVNPKDVDLGGAIFRLKTLHYEIYGDKSKQETEQKVEQTTVLKYHLANE